jgi:hypothetical protein
LGLKTEKEEWVMEKARSLSWVILLFIIMFLAIIASGDEHKCCREGQICKEISFHTYDLYCSSCGAKKWNTRLDGDLVTIWHINGKLLGHWEWKTGKVYVPGEYLGQTGSACTAAQMVIHARCN